MRLGAACALAVALAPAGSAGAAETALGELVVTARLRDEALNTAPVSVTALTARRLEEAHLTRAQDLPRQTPGLRFNAVDNSFAIRGLSSNAGSAATGLYIDDVPIQLRAIGSLPQSALPSLFDLERVEVDRGPQGTLFGAGAEGGVVRFVTAKPEFEGPAPRATSEVSGTRGGGASYALGLAGTAVLAPDAAALRLSAAYRHDGGWVDRADTLDKHVTDADANRGDLLSVRLSGLVQLSPTLTLTPMAMYESRRRHDSDEAWEALSDPAAGRYRNANPTALSDHDRLGLVSLGLAQDLGGADLIGTVAAFRRRQQTFYDGSVYSLSYLQQLVGRPLLTPTGFDLPLPRYAAPAPVANRQDNLSLELRLQSQAGGPLTWTAGVFLQRSRQRDDEAIVDPQFDALHLALFGQTSEEFYGYPLLPGARSYVGRIAARDRQAAAFGEATWRVTPALALTAGVRVARTRFSFTADQDGPFNAPGPSHAAGGARETPITPKVGVSYETGGRLLYLTIAKGYRIGGVNPALPAAFCAGDLAALGLDGTPAAYRSDTAWNYEAGVKGRAFGDRLEFAASAFRIDWRGIQQNVYLPGCGFQFTANAGRALSRGADLQLRARLSPSLRLRLDAGVVHARYEETARAGAKSDGAILAEVGDALPGAPWQVAAGVDWSFPLAGRPAVLSLDYETAGADRDGPVQNAAAQSYDARLPPDRSAPNLHLRLGVRLGAWEAALFGDNLTDAHRPLVRAHQDQGTDLFTITTPRPRSVGLTLTRGL